MKTITDEELAKELSDQWDNDRSGTYKDLWISIARKARELNGMSKKTEMDLEELSTLRHRAIELLGIINADLQLDPMSVIRFDKRIVEETNIVVQKINSLERNGLGRL